jgi:hypothetical protein
MIITAHWFMASRPTRYSCQNLLKLEFSSQSFKNTQVSNLMEIHPVIDDLFHADIHTYIITYIHNYMHTYVHT